MNPAVLLGWFTDRLEADIAAVRARHDEYTRGVWSVRVVTRRTRAAGYCGTVWAVVARPIHSVSGGES